MFGGTKSPAFPFQCDRACDGHTIWERHQSIFIPTLAPSPLNTAHASITDETIPMPSHDETLGLTVEIVAAYVRRNPVSTGEVPTVITSVFHALFALQNDAGRPSAALQAPAVNARRSITPDYIVCLEDGQKLKVLKRHLRTAYGMSPEEYRAKWGLSADYPMIAPNYSAKRSQVAKAIGLGRKSKKAAQAGRS